VNAWKFDKTTFLDMYDHFASNTYLGTVRTSFTANPCVATLLQMLLKNVVFKNLLATSATVVTGNL